MGSVRVEVQLARFVQPPQIAQDEGEVCRGWSGCWGGRGRTQRAHRHRRGPGTFRAHHV